MSNDIYSVDLLRSLPDVLKGDGRMVALATAIGNQLQLAATLIEHNIIYARIDSLPEALLDVLAYDFKVDWWNYAYTVEEKRRTLKGSWSVHRHLGTKYAVETAISAIYPGSEAEEWFDYGGKPYHFRVLLDLTHQNTSAPILNDAIIRAVLMYKSLRSQLEGDAVIYRSRLRFNIDVGCGYVPYQIRACGTYPVVATQGGVTEDSVSVYEKTLGTNYAVPMSGQSKTGRHPHIATQGAAVMGGFGIGETGEAAAYSSKLCGSAHGSIF